MKKKIIKAIVITISAFAVLFVALLVLVRYFFPNETVRQELEARLSKQVQGTAHIQSLKFDLLRGLEVKQVRVLKNNKRLINLDELTLDYNLWHLLRGKLVVNAIILNRVDMSLDLDDFQAVEKGDAQTVEPSRPTELPMIPVMVDLEILAIKDSNFRIARGTDFTASLEQVNLEAGLGLGPRTSELSGKLHVKQAEVVMQDKMVRLPLTLDFALLGHLDSETLEIKTLRLGSAPALSVGLSGKVKQFLTDKVIDLVLNDASIDLESTVSLVRDFLPPEVADAQIEGVLSPRITIQGALPASGLNGTLRVEVQGKDIHASLPSFGAALGRTTFTFKTSDMTVKGNVPEAIKAGLDVQTERAEFQSHKVEGFNLDLTGEHAAAGAFSGNLRVEGQGLALSLPAVGQTTQPFEVELDVSGHAKDVVVSLNRAMVKVGSLAKVLARGTLSQVRPEDGMRNVAATVEIEPHLEHLVSLVGENQAQGLILAKRGAADIVTVELKGQMDSTFRPHKVDLSGSLHLASLAAAIKHLNAQGRVDNLDVSWQGSYRARNGRLKGNLSAALGVSDVRYATLGGVKQASVTLGSNLDGNLSQDFGLTRLVSQDTVKIGFARLQYSDAGVNAQLPSLTVASKTREDLLGRGYQLDNLLVVSGSLFKVTGKGWYRPKGRQFSVDASLPYVDLGQLLKHVSGKGVQPLTRVDPSGNITFRLTASGRVPEGKKMDMMKMPVALSCRLKMKDVRGAFKGHSIAGANGSVDFSFEPRKENHLKALTDIRVDSVALPAGFPLKRASAVFATLNVTADKFDHLNIEDLHMGLDGAELSVNGSLTGLREFIEQPGKPPGTFLGPLFVSLQSRAAVDIGKLHGVLEPYGIEGSGRAEVALSVLKKERGQMDAQVHVNSRQLNLTKGATRLVNLNGGLSVRKMLGWLPGPNGTAPTRAFSPSTLLPQLRSFSSAGRGVQIEKMYVGDLAISKLAAGVKFDGSRLLIQNLAMNLLRGGLGGNLVLTTGKAFGVMTKLEATQLDVNDLLKPERKIQGDSLVDGIVDVTAFFDDTKGSLDLGKSEIDLFLTRIGQDALDRLLVFIDPEGSNPSIVGARSAVMLANPSTVRVTLRKGLLSLQIQFQKGVLSALKSFQINRIPVGRIKNFRNITQTIPRWETIREMMQLMGADHYGVDEGGKIILR